MIQKLDVLLPPRPHRLIKGHCYYSVKEFAAHALMAQQLGVQTYFTHTYFAWEKGTCENVNGKVQMFLLKKVDFSCKICTDSCGSRIDE